MSVKATFCGGPIDGQFLEIADEIDNYVVQTKVIIDGDEFELPIIPIQEHVYLRTSEIREGYIVFKLKAVNDETQNLPIHSKTGCR